jgi:hypothetical protein
LDNSFEYIHGTAILGSAGGNRGTFNNNRVIFESAPSTSAFLIGKFDYSVISGNSIIGTSRGNSCINITGGYYNVISANTMTSFYGMITMTGSSGYTSITGNMMKDGTYGISANGISTLTITGNYLKTIDNMLDVSSGAVIHGNEGIITEGTDTAMIGTGNTSVIVTHGLSITPTVCLASSLSIAGATFVISNINATSFRITIGDAASTDYYYTWYAAYV